MDRFENIDTFIHVVDAGGISSAAEQMGVAKSAVSRRLKELEMHLGVQLFHRTTRQMNLTDTGRVFYERSLRILDELNEAEQIVREVHSMLKGVLRVALPSSFGMMHMGPAITEFLQMHPQIEFDLDFNDREVDLMQERFDLAIRIARLPNSSLQARHLAPIKTVLCASPDYIKRRGTPQNPDDLVDHDCLVYSLLRDFEHWHFNDSRGRNHIVKINPKLKASTGEYISQAAIAGMGLILVPTFIVYRAIERGELQALLTEYQTPKLDAYAIYPQTRHLSQRVRVFIDFLVKRFSGVPYWDRCVSEHNE